METTFRPLKFILDSRIKMGQSFSFMHSNIEKKRRRLSVAGTDAGLDGLDATATNTRDVNTSGKGTGFIGIYEGKSQKGYAPYNPSKVNQDSLLLQEDTETGTLIVGTFDGHGDHGHKISDFISHHFYDYLLKNSNYKTNLKQAAIEALKSSEIDCLNAKGIKTDYSGTTAVICIVRKDYLLTLNVGDSRAVLATETEDDYDIEAITKDHKPDVESERKRIIDSGGRVFSVEYDDGLTGPPRVWLQDADLPGLAMSRSLGDKIAHTVGVISEPDIFEHTLTDKDRILMVGSDGIWEFISNREALDILTNSITVKISLDNLINTAWSRWMDNEQVVDDTTIAIVVFGEEAMEHSNDDQPTSEVIFE
ncbi:hypothetical protein WA158_008101 [Blastocystis sp. Blastoise]